MNNITSKENALIKHGVKLLQSRKYRHECGAFVTEGIKICEQALCGLKRPTHLFITKEYMEKSPKCLPELMEAAEEIFLISEAVAQKLSDTPAPRGVFCFWQMLDNQRDPVTINKGKYLILCSLQDPGNIGTIIRSCEAFGLDGLVLSADCPDIYAPKVLRSTMGGVFHLPIYISHDVSAHISHLKNKGFAVYAAALDAESQSLTKANWSGSTAVVIGNEGKGLPLTVIQACGQSLRIDMQGKAESLNAATAAAIIAWEMMR